MDESVNQNTNDNQAAGLTDEQKQQALEQMSDEQLLDAFAEQMMIDKGLKKQVDEQTFNSLKDDLKERLAFQVNRAILAQLPEDKLQEVGEKMDAGTLTAEEMDAAISGAKIDTTQTTEDVLLAFREAYIGAEAK